MSQLKSNPIKQIVRQELALDSYLATLLAEIPATEIIEQQEQLTVDVSVKAKTQIEKKKKTSILATRKIAVESSVVNDTPIVSPLQSLAVMPPYAQEEFSALFFKVGNLMLAAPLTDLSRTIRFDGNLTKIPQQPIWFMGLKEEQGVKLGILNMAYLVQGKTRASIRNYQDQPLENIILTEDGQWGFACDKVVSIAKVSPDKVRWRTNREKKPWLVGTIIDELVVIVDLNQLIPSRKRKSKN